MKNPFRRRHKTTSPDGLRVVEYPVTWQAMIGVNGFGGTYAAMYKRQSSIRSVIDLIATQCAELAPPKTYEKVPRSPKLPSGRLEVADYAMAELLADPRPGQDVFGFYQATFADIEVFDFAQWRKIRPGSGRPPEALQRIPNGALNPFQDPITQEILYWTTNRGERIENADLINFWGYDPLANFSSTPHMEALRQMLADEAAAQANRRGMWHRSLRKDGIIERDPDAPKMSDEARESFLIDAEDELSGADNSSRPFLLEPGMHWKESAWSPREMEYISARRLSRVEVCAEYHVPPSAVAAHLQGNEMDQDTIKILNQFTLPPRLARVESIIRAQLLPEFEKVVARRKLIYVEFNLATKLRGSFEELAAIMATTAGGPVVTVNEARARLNLPPVPGGDTIFVPLNSVRGGGDQASPQSPVQTPAKGIEPAGTTPGGGTAPQPAADGGAKLLRDDTEIQKLLSVDPPPIDEVLRAHEMKAQAEEQAAAEARLVERTKAATARATKIREQQAKYGERFTSTIHKTLQRQRSFLEPLGGGLKRERWDQELSDDLFSVAYPAVGTMGLLFAGSLETEFNHEQTAGYVRAYSDNVAQAINDQTEQLLADGEPLEDVLSEDRAAQLGESRANWVANWAPQEAVHQAPPEKQASVSKTWIVTSGNPRPSHASIDGETVLYDDTFGNGLAYPGDPGGGADETAGCTCVMDVFAGE